MCKPFSWGWYIYHKIEYTKMNKLCTLNRWIECHVTMSIKLSKTTLMSMEKIYMTIFKDAQNIETTSYYIFLKLLLREISFPRVWV
jgi:hypothetical protein